MADLQPASQESEHIGPGVTLSVTVWVLIAGGILSAIAGLVLTARSHTLAPAASASAPVRPEPEVSNIHTELFGGPGAGERLKAVQRNGLEHYGWVDRSRGLVRIPIDVAMDLESKEPRR
jgi:hypothetical protein